MLKKLLIANRGEIAVRVIRAARDLGIATVAVYSDADASALHVELADEAVRIGPPAAKKSYLNIAAILQAAADTGCDSIHPGYGFLAENAGFSDAVIAAGLVFVGPSGDAIRLMGDKVAARSAAHAAGVPVVPGSVGRVDGIDAARHILMDTGFPVMIKAAAGGGGRGIRIATNLIEFEHAFPQAEAEALAAFGDGGLYLEKVITKARHIEVQVLADGTDAVHCFERECSLQRRRQKVWEEAPSRALSPRLRDELCSSAVRLARAVNYSGAGTVEYLLDRCVNLKPGDYALMYAAAGGIGLFAGQWARHRGIHLIGVAAGAEKCAMARANGYHTVLDRRTDDVVARVREITGGRMLPAVFDSVGRDTWTQSLDMLAPRGTMVSFGNTTGPVPPFDIGDLARRGSLYVTRPSLAAYTATRDDLLTSAGTVLGFLASGAMTAHIGQRYRLEEAQQVHRDLEAGRTTGSTVMVP